MSNEQNVCTYYNIMQNHRIRDLLFHYEKIFLFWFLFSGKSASVEIHPALSVHSAVYQYMVRANDVKNTERQ